MFNPFFIGQFISGHLNIVYSYAIGPILFFTYDKMLLNLKFRWALIFSITFSLSFFLVGGQILYQIPLLILYTIILIIIDNINKKETIKLLSVCFVLSIFLYSFQLAPTLLGAQSTYTQPKQDLSFKNIEMHLKYSFPLKESLIGMPKELNLELPNKIYFYILSDSQMFLINLIIPIFAFLAICFRKDRYILLFSIATLFSIFISKGPHQPLNEIYLWSYFNIPLFESLRVPNRWLIITFFSYAFLCGITLDALSRKMSKINGYQLSKIFSILLISIILVSSGYGIIYGFKTFSFPQNIQDNYLQISKDSSDFRIATFPYYQTWMKSGSGYGQDIEIMIDWGIASSFFTGKPVIGKGGWELNTKDFVLYSYFLTITDKTQNWPKIVGSFDIKYVVDQKYPPTEVPIHQNTFLEKQKGMKTIYSSKNGTIYENTYWIPRIFTTSKSALVVGGRESLTSLAEINEFNFREFTLFFANQVFENDGREKYIDLFNKSDALIFVNSKPLDLTILMLDDKIRIKPAQYAYPSIDAKEHWIASDTATKTGMFALNSMTLSTFGENDVSIQIKSEKDGSYEVWTRLIYDKNAGKLGISIDGEEIGSIVPYSKIRNIKWVKLGNIDLRKGDHALTLQNKKSSYGVTNEIDEIILAEPDKLANKIDEVNNELEKSNRIIIISETQKVGKITDFLQISNFPKLNYQQSEFKDYLIYYTMKEEENEVKFPDFFKTEDSYPEINYTKINPTKYEVKVKTDKPFFLIFSDSYHPLWRAYIDGEEIQSIISYSFINGFYIQKTGEYEVTIEFIGQRYVWIGGIISLTTFIFAISYILFENRMLQIFRRIRKILYGEND
jgi:hypothetical protein